MRKLTAGLFVSLDGVAESPDSWVGPYWSDEMNEAIATGVVEADAVLIGRRTYELFRQIWAPQGTGSPMAAFLNTTHKYVMSSTLDTLDWGPASPIRTVEEIADLKRRPGRNIQVPGSPTLVRWLLREGLLDELNLNIAPLVVGSGMRLFDDGPRVPLTLTQSTILSTGVIGVTYRRAEAAS